MKPTGCDTTRLVVLRGPSGSGKSTVAVALRKRLGRSIALVEQDYLRRIVLKEHDVPGGANIALIDQTVRFALDHGWHVVLEGILDTRRYAGMLDGLSRDHAGHTGFYYFDMPWDETVRRHRTREHARDFGVEDMRGWYRRHDQLDFTEERLISADSGLDETVGQILGEVFTDSVQ